MTALQTLRALLDAATPGPWFLAYAAIHDKPRTDEYMRLERTIPEDAPEEAYGILPDSSVCHMPVCAGDTPTSQGLADGNLIAALRNAAPVLLEIAEAAVAYHNAEVNYIGDVTVAEAALFAAVAKLEGLK